MLIIFQYDTPLQCYLTEIPWKEEPSGLQSMESQRVGHDLATKQQQATMILKAV